MNDKQKELLLAVLDSAKCVYEDKENCPPKPAYYNTNEYPPETPSIVEPPNSNVNSSVNQS